MSSSYTIKKVALAGAAGNVGPHILDALLQSGFEVTVFTREGSKSTSDLPSSVTVKTVDYNSLDSLTSALKGQDAFISTIGTAAVKGQLLMIEAAAKAGVKRFIPSEFGSNTDNANVIKLPYFADKVKTGKALEEAAETSSLTYTLVHNGPFLDWTIKVGFMIDIPKKTINIRDSGDQSYSTSVLPDVARAVVGVLKHPEETKNRVVKIQSTLMTQNKLLEMAQQATGGPEGWTVNHISLDDMLEKAYAEFKKEKPDPYAFIPAFLSAAVFGGDKYGAGFDKLDNDLLGVKERTDDEIQALVNSFAKN